MTGPVRTPETAPLVDALNFALEALLEAPHKHRIDFQPYWDWYAGARTGAVEHLQKILGLETSST
jgi:hypothetical protein